MKDQFIKELKKLIGEPYILGGGQMNTYKGMPNKDDQGNWIGFDCCGGIMHALRQATGINLKIRNVPGMMKAPWLSLIEISGNFRRLIESDIIFCDIPTLDENGDVMRDEEGYPVYGRWNHVMTWIGEMEKGNIITTRYGGDRRKNPQSKGRTDYWNLESFQIVSSRLFENETRYQYMRVNWYWLEVWKKNHPN